MLNNQGFCEGERCHRDGCQGVIEIEPVENCSCHISPPCSACTAPRAFCPECDWHEKDEPGPDLAPTDKADVDHWAAWRVKQERLASLPLDNTKVSWRSKSHSSCSMIKEGVYPEGMTMEQVRKEVDGTFGGRFERFGGGAFKFIAYTD